MKNYNFDKILIANRGEIALRIIGAIKSLGMRSVVVHSLADEHLPFVTHADEAFSLGSGSLRDTYLDQEKIIRIAKKSGADAIHPGYGFLAENADFALRCQEEQIVFIGPRPEAIRIMGEKSRAREKAMELGVPLLKGFTGEISALCAAASELPYPVLIKPSAGGGGKGMRIVHKKQDFEKAAIEASREAENYFGSGALYVEQYLSGPRHIEVQVLADHHGNAVHLFERECSIQRRHQKIIEEAPSPSIDDKTRSLITESALKLVKGIGYTNAGTVEFLMDDSGSFYFLEMNTRIQVEHPVTEMITGRDLVKEQITIAQGDPLSFKQEDLKISGHAIEARIYAESPGEGFMPSAGTIRILRQSTHPHLRIDSGYRQGNQVESDYDPMIAKVIAHGNTRNLARRNLIEGLKNFHITGLETNRDYLVSLLQTEAFAQNRIDTNFVEREAGPILKGLKISRDEKDRDLICATAAFLALQPTDSEARAESLNAARAEIYSPWYSMGYWRMLPEISLLENTSEFRIKYDAVPDRKKMKLTLGETLYEVSIEKRQGNDFLISLNGDLLKLWASKDHSEIHLDVDGHFFTFRRPDIPDDRYLKTSIKEEKLQANQLYAPLNGRIVQIDCKEGDRVEKDQPLLIIESMKMENKILAPRSAIIVEGHVSVGEQVFNKQLLFTLDNYDRPFDE